MGVMFNALSWHGLLPVNALEKVRLINTLLLLRWLYRELSTPTNNMFRTIGIVCLSFILAAQDMESNSDDIHWSHRAPPSHVL